MIIFTYLWATSSHFVNHLHIESILSSIIFLTNKHKHNDACFPITGQYGSIRTQRNIECNHTHLAYLCVTGESDFGIDCNRPVWLAADVLDTLSGHRINKQMLFQVRYMQTKVAKSVSNGTVYEYYKKVIWIHGFLIWLDLFVCKLAHLGLTHWGRDKMSAIF